MKTNLENYIKSRRPIIWINSNDYKEIDGILKNATMEIKDKEIYEYSAIGGRNILTGESLEFVMLGLTNFLDTMYGNENTKNLFLIIKNVDDELKDPMNIAYIKKYAERVYSDTNFNATIIVISEKTKIPKELEKFTSILEIPNMKQEEIKKYVIKFAENYKKEYDKEDLGELSMSLKGLSKLEIDHILNMIISERDTISFSSEMKDMVIKEKGQIIKKSSILEIIDFKESIEDIGGLNGLKEWLETKAQIFRNLDIANKFGVDTPKGVLLVGMPGCGKSLSAKVCARLFNAPLLRLDIGRLLGKYVGESEHNMRVALRTAESISPCILWIDEIEKAFSGIDQNGGASDITKRLFGQFLTWLQEKENTVFVVATANDISAFPPEFLRKGRFDEIFFVDFPDKAEREKIFEIHLRKRNKLNDKIDLSKLAGATDGYCGADIEEIVKTAVESKFVAGKLNTIQKNELFDVTVGEENEMTTNDLLDAKKNIDSLTSILDEQIKKLKESYKKFKIKSASKEIGKNRQNKRLSELKDMVKVSGGKYKPSFRNDEVKVLDLEVAKYQTTNELWYEVMYNKKNLGSSIPVVDITYNEILEFCNKLSEKYGLQPVYELKDDNLMIKHTDGEIVYPDQADFSKTEGFRLPTEVEWEWFARGGEIAIQNKTFDYEFSGSKNIEKVAVYGGQSRKNVGLKKSNSLGLYDCSGNVWELCYDTWEEDVYTEKLYVYDTNSESHICKGGSSESSIDDCSLFSRSSVRVSREKHTSSLLANTRRFFDDYFGLCFGFRLVRTL